MLRGQTTRGSAARRAAAALCALAAGACGGAANQPGPAAGVVHVDLFNDAPFDAMRCYDTLGGDVLGDVNGDGRLDLVGLDAVALGDGRGGFLWPRGWRTRASGAVVAVGDFNLDGRTDFFRSVGFDTLYDAEVLLGGPAGSLAPGAFSFYGIPTHPVGAVAFGDFDGDGALDVAYVTSKAQAILLGDGHGGTRAQLPLDPSIVPSVAADLDGDGKADLFALEGSTRRRLLLGNGDGTFRDAGVTSPPHAIRDLDGDGALDLIAQDPSTGAFLVERNDGHARFQVTQTIPAPALIAGLAVADVDGDRVPDLVLGDAGSWTIGWLRGRGDATFAPQDGALLIPELARFQAADLDGDGRAEILVGDCVAHDWSKGASAMLPSYGVGLGDVSQVVLTDVNGDGRLDAVVARETSATLSVFRGDGRGGFDETPIVTKTPAPVAELRVADLDGDGRAELVGNVSHDSNVGEVVVWKTSSGGQLLPAVDRTGARLRAVGDVDGDGATDVALVDDTGAAWWSLEGVALERRGPLPAGLLTLADLNGDGRADALGEAPQPGGEMVFVALTDRSGAFSAPVDTGIRLPQDKLQIVAGDVDGDGRSDLVIGLAEPDLSRGPDEPRHLVTVALGDGRGQFAALVPDGIDEPFDQLLVQDLDGDGRADVVLSGGYTGKLFFRRARADGTFVDPEGYYTGGGSFAAIGDLDGDGRPDLVAAGRSPGALMVLRNVSGR